MAQTKSLKVKKKRWYPILAPKMFKQVQVGEMFLDDPRKSVGRTITTNLMEITNDMKKQNINIRFSVSGSEGDNIHTAVSGYDMVPASIKRMVRRGRERIDYSSIFSTADNKNIRLKAILLTRFKVKGSVERALVKSLQDYLVKTISRTKYDDLVGDIVFHKFQKALYSNLSRIYPLKNCEVRSMKIEERKKAKKVKIEEEPEDTEDLSEEDSYQEDTQDEKQQEKAEKQKPAEKQEKEQEGDKDAKASD